jgi:D-serine deaminase-like pyridoxal phosphate-dependent protein
MTGPPLTARIDLERLDRNLRRFHARATAFGVAVRSHVKAHMTVEIALRQLLHGTCGLAVTQVAQARAYVAAGVTDLVMAYPWREPWRWALMAELARDCRLSVLVDSHEAVRGLAAASEAAGSVIAVRVNLGDDEDVTAVADDDLIALARAADAEPALRLDGVHGYQSLNTAEAASERVKVGRAAAEYVVRVAGLLRGRGLPCPVVAVSGTPTAQGALAVPGVTEVCAGAYALQDTGMAAIGVCATDDLALSVVAGDPRAADPILAAHPYPWQTPADYALLASSAPASTPIHPPHICALVRQIDTVTPRAADEGSSDVTWRVINQRDQPG